MRVELDIPPALIKLVVNTLIQINATTNHCLKHIAVQFPNQQTSLASLVFLHGASSCNDALDALMHNKVPCEGDVKAAREFKESNM